MLTEKQISVCRLIAEGRADKQIAADLKISEHTVSFHLRKLYAIARVKSRTELALWFVFLSDENSVKRRLQQLHERAATRR